MGLSVLMSVYMGDDPSLINQAMESIWDEQFRKPNQIVLVKDGPVNKAISDVIADWERRLAGHLILVELEQNAGLAAALNAGLSHCSYEMIARMDADDISMPKRFERQISFLNDNPDVDVVGGAIIDFRDGRDLKVVQYPLKHDQLRAFFRFRDPLAHPAVIFRKRFFEKVGFYDGNLMKDQDTELWFRGFKDGAIFANIEESVLRFRYTPELFRRRKDIKRTIVFFKLRWMINRELGYGLDAYIYLFAYSAMQLLPVAISKYIYEKYR